MIDPADETLIALADWPARLPRRRGGKKVHRATLHRWDTSGSRGVVLETVQVGGTRCASPAAMCRFFAAIAAAGSSIPSRTPRQRIKAIADACRELEQAGA